MDSGVVRIFKEDPPNLATWQPLGSSVREDTLFNSTAFNDTWDAEEELTSPIIPIIAAVYSIVFVVGLVGNCLVMYVIIR
ncbi:hypothetical protein NHX12_004375 [Muraenolepis orangiensis]|uniref:Uncharacterized protein n=1 Tax=Muraenolepis orangiensis TaxID=630683 RepID=A0A9Q0DXM7_9TELE|nr:hypothetical protein NHX12_004375 [Muraenolepis orangiensis]